MKRSITLSRYLSWIVIIFFILLVSAGFSSLWTLNSIMQNSFMELNELSSILVSSRLEEFFLRSKDSMAHIVHMVEQPDLYRRENLQAYLDDTIVEFQFIDRLEIVGPDNRVMAVAPAEPDNLRVSRKGEKVYEAVLETGTLYWSDSYISLKSNQPAITFGFTTGSYVVLMDINLRWFSDFTSRIQAIQDKNFEIRLTDGNGVFIYHTDMIHVFQRERQSNFPMIRDHIDDRKPIVLTEGKQTWFVAAQVLAEPAWYVLVLYPRDNFIANLHRSLAGLAGFSALAAGMGVLFWRMRLKKITNAFSAISTEADRIARGDYGQLANFGEGFKEFSNIGDSLNQMVGAIGSREATLRDRERGFRQILESIELAAVIVESDGTIRYINPYALHLLGYGQEELMGQPFQAIFCDPQSKCPFDAVLKGRVTSSLERSVLRMKNGGDRIIDWSIVKNLDADGRLSGSTGIGHDTTEMIHARESVEKSLKEKDVLLQEVHHRVKNNLQIITSLLSLQEADTGNPDVLGALEDASARIQSIALVHELLYDSKDFGELDFRTYLESLTVHQLNRKIGKPIRYHFNFDQFPLSLTDAVPCGLIVNEAITNSLKHGFPSPDHPGPCIEFSGGLVTDGLARIEIRDNGVGIDEEFEYKEGKHLGLTIMRVLADQIKGKLRIYKEHGTVVELVFKPGSIKSATDDVLPG